ncbi:thioredoxin family protein [Pararhizobium sp. BT-229]|nr:thioredoxin family protein [Pararhizobium sp. BT-229]MCV9966178.1 thioredoxin family protein [Pararhizobium sp. BT-229]
MLACGFGLMALPAAAGDPAGVVELFTSQGCSSCPPADAALKRLIDDGKVVALSYHVDYWNYLGWADTLATKDNTARQYAYAKMLGRSGVYTPQAVLNGRDHINGADLAGINRRLTEMDGKGQGLDVPVEAAVRNDEIDIKVGAGNGKANVVVVYFNREQQVDVTKGENSGKKISYWHSVRDIQTIGMWDGKPANFVLPASVLNEGENSGCAVLLQKMKDNETPGAILGATTVMSAKAAN